jgi:hypothetical protein
MSVQKVLPDFSIVTACPLIITPAETVLTYQTASAVAINQNVNGRSNDCFPNDYAYLQVRPSQQPTQCCSNNALKSYNKNIAGVMNQGY